MGKLVIQKMDKADIDEVAAWDEEFEGDSRYDSIRQFILEDNIYYNIGEVIRLNYEEVPIGDDEILHAIVIKDTAINKVAGFAVGCEFDINTNTPSLFLQNLVLHPDYQGKGYGSEIVKRIITNQDKILTKAPTYVFSYIHEENYPSQKAVKKLGFNLRRQETQEGCQPSVYYKAELELTKEETKE